jgi:hypothetical protein
MIHLNWRLYSYLFGTTWIYVYSFTLLIRSVNSQPSELLFRKLYHVLNIVHVPLYENKFEDAKGIVI